MGRGIPFWSPPRPVSAAPSRLVGARTYAVPSRERVLRTVPCIEMQSALDPMDPIFAQDSKVGQVITNGRYTDRRHSHITIIGRSTR